LSENKHKILIIDDDPQTRQMIGQFLNLSGYETMAAREGKEALDLYESERQAGRPFDAVTLDLEMPFGMGGAETMKKLLAADKKVKVIVCSADCTNPIMENPKKFGFVAALEKPFTGKELNQILATLLD
jgi:two-component system, cell cycle sensor histidine kinase and response regulator CckA